MFAFVGKKIKEGEVSLQKSEQEEIEFEKKFKNSLYKNSLKPWSHFHFSVTDHQYHCNLIAFWTFWTFLIDWVSLISIGGQQDLIGMQLGYWQMQYYSICNVATLLDITTSSSSMYCCSQSWRRKQYLKVPALAAAEEEGLLLLHAVCKLQLTTTTLEDSRLYTTTPVSTCQGSKSAGGSRRNQGSLSHGGAFCQHIYLTVSTCSSGPLHTN